MRTLTNEEVITKSRKIHGDKYEYIIPPYYVSSKDKLGIICKKHGIFYQLLSNHLKGCGCPECGDNRKLSTEEYVSKLKEKYKNDNIIFDKVKYINNHTPIILICKEHGEWSILPTSLLKNLECPICRKKHLYEQQAKTTEKFVEEAHELYGDEYDYINTHYKNNKSKVCITCKKHGEFWQLPNNHLKGEGCPKCSREKAWNKRERVTTESLIARFQKVHGYNYDYSSVEYKTPKDKVKIECLEHGYFYQLPYAHLNGQGCPKCGKNKLSQIFAKSNDEFIKEANAIHNNEFDYHNTHYKNCKKKVEIICRKHGSFWQSPMSHLKGTKCPMCYAELSVSKNEIEFRDFVQKLCVGEIIRFNARNIISPLELDIVNTVRKIAFEYDGLYWHSNEKVKDKNYHLNKTKKCIEKGYRLIHVFEDEWLNKKDIVKSRIGNILGKTQNRIGARKCIIKEITPSQSREFLNKNHLQGNVNSSIRYGLFYKEELVSVMTFRKLRKSLGCVSEEHVYELTRFCNKLNYNIIGAASKLLKHFVKCYSPIKIISYADKRWSNGNMYYKLGFEHIRDSKPSYFYTLNGKERENRFVHRKDVLAKEGYYPNKSESQIMKERRYFKIYDCGCMVFEKRF